MQLKWEVNADDVAKVHTFLARMKDNPFVTNRIRNNVTGPRPMFSKDRVWHEMVACLLTTQQRSGPNSAISRLIGTDPFPLSYSISSVSVDLETLVRDTVANAGGIRRKNRIADEVKENLRRFENGLWGKLEAVWSQLAASDDRALERTTARMIDHGLKGFGPKQSRNLLQVLGLTKYETPIDSRIVKWLGKFDFPLRVPASALMHAEVYELVMDGIQELCRKCDVYPCVLDAAIFASFDGEGWDKAKLIW